VHIQLLAVIKTQMNYQEEMHKLTNQVQDKLAMGVSTIIRSINDKEKIVVFLRKMKDLPSADIVNRINQIALKNEDYETCEALNIYAKERGIELIDSK
jgi:hypothetical protein